jgi:hypothetical protein
MEIEHVKVQNAIGSKINMTWKLYCMYFTYQLHVLHNFCQVQWGIDSVQ